MKKRKKQINKQRRNKEKETACKHKWLTLVAQKGKKIIPVPAAKICFKCGEMKMGEQTVKISRFRVAIEGGTKLKIPVGTNMYS